MLGSFIAALVTALSLLVVDLIIPGVRIDTFVAALIAAVAIGVVNGLIRPVLQILSLPLTLITFGLFSIVVNGLCFWLASLFVPGFSVSGPLAFLLGPIVLSFASTFLNRYLGERRPGLMGTETSELQDGV
ncbi:phage holin family protein [Romeria aff. gracilis LEGE 07310]|uniref:Phage holin family protein n=1 Tax=Vasconcelosia minhoensis LEGE 07310 TaxID=915328 RepID=A0A8J7A8R3_9CYAN|nr:phage holin family protein [Romeria gracilis]MBE9076061.1 phage holin family protein [Romeria aff. gracilis LEGE 07310]